ncbi:hypothetical protein JCM1841_000405 [Sporobolomyces salmonicolor]
MVVNLSYKLTHLAQSFRPQHHFQSLRSAFPSASTSSPGFDFTSNVFGSVQNAAANTGASAGGATAIGAAALGAGAGAAAGAGAGGAAGGAGGASSKAGSWSSHWGFQTTKSLSQTPAAQADSSNDDDTLRALASPHRRLLAPRRQSATSASATLAFRLRQSQNSLSSVPPDLLHAEEAGLSSVRVRLSSAEMQRRYHSAFSQGKRTDEVDEMQKEQENVDLGPERKEAEAVRKTGRRASISEQPSSPMMAQKREMHTSATAAEEAAVASAPAPSAASPPADTPFSTNPPPSPSRPTTRRHSTSDVTSESTFPTPLDEGVFSVPRSSQLTERRPRASSPSDPTSRRSPSDRTPRPRERPRPRGDENLSPEAAERRNALHVAEQTGKIALVEQAIRSYLADPSTWNTESHNVAMNALYRLRRPDSPLDTIVKLYNQLFEHDGLRPNTRSYEIILKAFCVRDSEVRRNIGFLERRMKKRELAGAARGVWNVRRSAEGKEGDSAPTHEADESQYLLERERERLAALRTPEFDYFSPAIKIFQALGPLGDRLSPFAVQLLLEAAVDRGEVDLALALFERMEKSVFQKAGIKAYDALIRMYGGVEKDKDLVLEVFEAYLAARASGQLRLPTTMAYDRPAYRTQSIKHAYDTSPEYVVDESKRTATPRNGDQMIWRSTIKALFEAGDAAGAVTILERLLVAQNAPETMPAGYPKTVPGAMVATIVGGFVRSGDAAAAKRWFDRLAHPEDAATAELQPAQFYVYPLYIVIDSPFLDLLNHIYRSMLSRASPGFFLTVSDFFTVVDYNLARAWKSESAEERAKALDAVAEFRVAFEAATKKGFIDGDVGVGFTVSTGLLGRICQATGYHSRFSEAAATFAEYANIVRAIMARAPIEHRKGARTRKEWVFRATDIANAALGLKPSPTGSIVTFEHASSDRPSLKDALKVVGWTNKLRNVIQWAPMGSHELIVVEAYLRERDIVLGNEQHLSGDEWYTVIEAFAHTQALVKRGMHLSFSFPGFELAIDDFLASGVSIPAGTVNYDYAGLVQALKAGGVPRNRILATVNAMNHGLADNVGAEPEEPVVAAPLSDDAVSVDSVPVATSATSVTEDAALASTVAESAHFPTPPSTPPAYFAELAPAPPAAPSFEFENLNRSLSQKVDNLVYTGKTGDALNLVVGAAQEGQFAHPDSYGRLIEQLGRQHEIAEVRQVYLLAYSALNAMESQPEAQSLAWVALEDRMIVALAQAGELVDVGHHRDRLLQAGCAPSADGYAAMILNMKETTDDAAVALMLFEESQRLNVRPNVYLFNTLISKLSRARRAKEALEYFELMKTFGLRPSSITYGAIINACCKTGDDVSADYLFNEMISHPEFKPRVPPYNTMIQFYTSTKPDRQRALHYYNELTKARVPPTGHTYKLLLDAYGSIGEPDLEAMQQVFARLVQDRRVSVTGAHWASLIHAYGSVVKNLDRAIAIFDSIPAHPSTRNNPNGPLPDAVVYEALLNALLANERPDLSDKYLHEMRDKGVRMTAYVANSLIKGHTTQNNFAAARAVFLAMQDPPVGVASAGNHSVDRHPKHHRQASAAMPVDAPVYREPSTYEAMVRCELKAGEPAKAAELLKMAEARAFPPAVIARLQRLLTEVGIETLPFAQ